MRAYLLFKALGRRCVGGAVCSRWGHRCACRVRAQRGAKPVPKPLCRPPSGSQCVSSGCFVKRLVIDLPHARVFDVSQKSCGMASGNKFTTPPPRRLAVQTAPHHHSKCRHHLRSMLPSRNGTESRRRLTVRAKGGRGCQPSGRPTAGEAVAVQAP